MDRLELWDHQKKAVSFAREVDNVALFFQMGTGKTFTAIKILQEKYNEAGRMLPTLILAPSVVVSNWKQEFLKFAPNTRPGVIVPLSGTGAKIIKFLKSSDGPIAKPGMIIVTNYEKMQNDDIFQLLLKWSPQILVCDESHRCKSIKSKRAKRVVTLADQCKHRYLLTGTPILNTAEDLFQQYRIMDGGDTFGKNFYSFRAKYFEDKNSGMPSHVHFPNYVLKKGALNDFNKILSRTALRATKEDCLDLPPLVRQTINIEMSPEQKRMYKEMKNDYITFVKEQQAEDKPKAVVAQLAITRALRLQQIVSGFVKTDDGKSIAMDKVPRLQALKELLEDITGAGDKVIVWASFRDNYKQIREVCEKLKIKAVELHGEVKSKDKDKNMEAFRKDPEVKVIIANAASAGMGINLVEAKYSIYYSKNFSLEQDIQSEARNHRGGSEMHDKVTRIDLVSPDTIDELINEALAKKQNLADYILDVEL